MKWQSHSRGLTSVSFNSTRDVQIVTKWLLNLPDLKSKYIKRVNHFVTIWGTVLWSESILIVWLGFILKYARWICTTERTRSTLRLNVIRPTLTDTRIWNEPSSQFRARFFIFESSPYRHLSTRIWVFIFGLTPNLGFVPNASFILGSTIKLSESELMQEYALQFRLPHETPWIHSSELVLDAAVGRVMYVT